MKYYHLIRVFAICLYMAVPVLGAEAQTVVNSFAQLMPYLNDHNVDVVMTPGTYRVTPADFGNGKTYSNPHLFEFTGTNSVFDFTGVTFEVETEVLQAFGNVDIREVYVSGNDLVLKNLTLMDIGRSKPTFRAQAILLDGRRNRIEGFNVATRGSYPYGYGDIFGKGGGPVIGHDKHSAILVRGIDSHLKNTKIFHRSYGHGIFCQGSQRAIIEGCYVEGETRTSDDVLAEEGSGSPADNANFLTNWGEDENGENGYRLQPGWMFSLHEAGIRAYNTGLSIDGVNSTNTTDITVIDCTVNKMRTGVNVGFCNDTKHVENCVIIDVESAFWMGTYGEIINCAANAAYGPLWVSNYSNDRDSVGDITVLDSSNRYGNDLLAYITGHRDEVTLRTRNETVDTNLAIRVSGIRTGIRQHVINPKYNDFSATDAVLHNYTQFPVEMAEKSTGTSGQTGGSVVDLGSGNNLSPITVNTTGGFGVIQTIEAEDFSGQSGASVQTLGDGIRYAGVSSDGDWIRFDDFFFGSGPNQFEAFVKGGVSNGTIEIRLDGVGGELIGTCPVSAGAGSWVAETIALDEPRGKHDVFLVFKGTTGSLPGIDRFRFYVTFSGWESSKGLVGHWKFDDASGTVATDSSGYGHHGTMANAAWVNGKKAGALDFDGSSSTVSIPPNAFDSINEEITYAFWAFGDAAQSANNSILYAKDGNNKRVLNIHLPYGGNSPKVYWDAGYQSGSYDRIDKSASDPEFKGSWTHWAFTKNAKTGNMRIYRNGEIWHAGPSKMRGMTGITAATIGSQIGGSLSYNGIIDDVRLYDVELMEHEVTELYDSYSYADSGTPHSWLDAHGLVTDSDYATADLLDGDSDGLLNGEEYWAGTNPTNPASSFQFVSADAVDSQMIFDWSGVEGKNYDIWFKTNLMDGAWVLLEKNVAGIEPSCTSTVQTDQVTGFIQVEVQK